MRWQAQRADAPPPAFCNFHIAPDGRKLAIFPGATEVEIEEVDTGKQIAALQLPASNSEYACNGHWVYDRTLLVEGPEDSLWLWDISKPSALPLPTSNYPSCFCSSPDGLLLATGQRGVVTVNSWILPLPTALQRPASWCFGSPHDVYQPSPIIIRDIRTGRVLGQTRLGNGWVSSIDFSPDGSRLAATDMLGRVLLFDVPRMRE